MEEEEINLEENTDNTETVSQPSEQQPVTDDSDLYLPAYQSSTKTVRQEQDPLLSGGYEYMPRQTSTGADISKADLYPSDENIMVGQANLPGLGTVPQYVARGGLYPIGVHYAMQKSMADNIKAQQDLYIKQQDAERKRLEKTKLPNLTIDDAVKMENFVKWYVGEHGKGLKKYGYSAEGRTRYLQSEEFKVTQAKGDTYKKLFDQTYQLANTILEKPEGEYLDESLRPFAEDYLKKIYNLNPDTFESDLEDATKAQRKLKDAITYTTLAKELIVDKMYSKTPYPVENYKGSGLKGIRNVKSQLSDAEIKKEIISQVESTRNFKLTQQQADRIFRIIKPKLPAYEETFSPITENNRGYYGLGGGWLSQNGEIILKPEKSEVSTQPGLAGNPNKVTTFLTPPQWQKPLAVDPSGEAVSIDEETGMLINYYDGTGKGKLKNTIWSGIDVYNLEGGKIKSVTQNSNPNTLNLKSYVKFKAEDGDKTVTYHEPLFIDSNGSINQKVINILADKPEDQKQFIQEARLLWRELNTPQGKEKIIKSSNPVTKIITQKIKDKTYDLSPAGIKKGGTTINVFDDYTNDDYKEYKKKNPNTTIEKYMNNKLQGKKVGSYIRDGEIIYILGADNRVHILQPYR